MQGTTAVKRNDQTLSSTRKGGVPTLAKVVVATVLIAGAILLALGPLLHTYVDIDLSLRNILLMSGGAAVGASLIVASFLLCYFKETPAAHGRKGASNTVSRHHAAQGSKPSQAVGSNQTPSDERPSSRLAALLFALSINKRGDDDLLDKIRTDMDDPALDMIANIGDDCQMPHDRIEQVLQMVMSTSRLSSYSYQLCPHPRPYVEERVVQRDSYGSDPYQSSSHSSYPSQRYAPQPVIPAVVGNERSAISFNRTDDGEYFQWGIEQIITADARSAVLSIGRDYIGLRRLNDDTFELFNPNGKKGQHFIHCANVDEVMRTIDRLIPKTPDTTRVEMYLYGKKFIPSRVIFGFDNLVASSDSASSSPSYANLSRQMIGALLFAHSEMGAYPALVEKLKTDVYSDEFVQLTQNVNDASFGNVSGAVQRALSSKSLTSYNLVNAPRYSDCENIADVQNELSAQFAQPKVISAVLATPQAAYGLRKIADGTFELYCLSEETTTLHGLGLIKKDPGEFKSFIVKCKDVSEVARVVKGLSAPSPGSPYEGRFELYVYSKPVVSVEE